ncbi:MAG: class C sortase [Coriobacteriaceae bacterium]|nr:class C sortase [Coriobacteriaceae bacterium]
MGVQLGHIEFTRRNVALAVLFLVGFCIFMYPFVNNWHYQNVADDIIAQYGNAVDADANADYDAAFARAQKYNERLVGQTVPDVFAIREGTTDEEYESYLNVMGNGMMGVVEIPAIGVRLPIYHYSTAASLEKGAAHIFGSSLPVGGESSHSVVTAHRGLPAAEMFSNLDQLVEGDRFFLRILDRTLAYEVDNIEVVAPSETRSLAIERGSDLCTLVTCTPYGVNTDRLLVRGHRVPYADGDENVGAIRPFGFLTKLAVAGAGVLVALVLLWLYARWRKRRAGETADAAIDAEALKPEHGAKVRHRA